ncbi:hypothetical protein LOTGIDRAFT_184680 [Lottia gigantea]|uniref:S-acyl fatty acid synthase thioesterase, medium chain n=1 Tax=Lottia gigantea TaxID=225164 RepID=V3ZFM1_LOTGI|nr:hypothetical protein LOTGIDRAFT_184680 [Lottia gigantea]ESO82877.1 hypothetical protein LOTGIDRAFT_184680 [Lottia gigantea]
MPSKLMNCRFPRRNATVRLFCFPWAGGGSNFNANWGSSINENIEVVAILLPGRESRFTEPPIRTMSEVVDVITKAIVSQYSAKPFAFFGHSMGALLSFEIAKVLKEKHNMQPVKMYVSGMSGPREDKDKDTSKTQKRVCEATDKEFIEFLRGMGGTPDEILNNEEIMEVFLPVLRADYGMVDDHKFELPPSPTPMLTCPVDVFGGKQDSDRDYEAWRRITSGKVNVTMRDGGHFYLKEKKNTEFFYNLINGDF